MAHGLRIEVSTAAQGFPYPEMEMAPCEPLHRGGPVMYGSSPDTRHPDQKSRDCVFETCSNDLDGGIENPEIATHMPICTPYGLRLGRFH